MNVYLLAPTVHSFLSSFGDEEPGSFDEATYRRHWRESNGRMHGRFKRSFICREAENDDDAHLHHIHNLDPLSTR